MKILIVSLALLAACTDTYDYKPVEAGDQDGTARAPRGKTSSQFVRTVYADLLGRTPTAYDFTLSINGTEQVKFPIDEESVLVNTLDGIGDGGPLRNLLVAGIVHAPATAVPTKASVADPRAYIHDQFTRLLGREPNAYELEAFVDAWTADPAVGPATVIRAIVGSREYQSQ